jgi:hypothetical protein
MKKKNNLLWKKCKWIIIICLYFQKTSNILNTKQLQDLLGEPLNKLNHFLDSIFKVFNG